MKHSETSRIRACPGTCSRLLTVIATCIGLGLLSWSFDRGSINVALSAYVFNYGFFVNAVPVLLVFFLLLTLSNRWALSTVATVLLTGGIYAINTLKLQYLRTPVSFGDIYILENLHVATIRLLSHYLNLWYLAGGLLLVIVAIFSSARWEPAFFGRRRWPRLAVGAATLFCLYGIVSGSAWVANAYNAKRLRIIPWSPELSVLHAGLFSTLVNTNAERFRILDVPVDDDAASGVIGLPLPVGALPPTASHDAPPDIVVIQSESFFDPAILKDVDSTDAELPNLKRALATGVGGTMKAPTFGGGTLRTEFEVLTGIPMAAYPAMSFPYLQITKRSIPGIVHVVHDAGYEAIAIHGNGGGFWNRSKAFKAIGFDQFVTAADFPKDAAREGWYYADSAMTDQIIQKLTGADKPAFIFAISIEAHGPYLNIPVNDTNERDHLPAPADIGKAGALEYRNYLYHIRNADRQLGRLWKFLASRNRPYILVFYGDHLPGLQQVYSAAGFDNGGSAPEQFVPWLIVGSHLTNQSRHIHSWALGSEILSSAGITLPPYYRLIAKAQAAIRAQRGTAEAEATEQGVYSLARLYMNGELGSFMKHASKENGHAPAKSP